MDLITTVHIRVPWMCSDVIWYYFWQDHDTSSLKPLSSTQFCGSLNQMVVSIPVCGRSGLWPFWLVTVSVCGHSGLWPFQFVAASVSGRFGLWPFRFVAILVCGHLGLCLFRFWLFRFVAIMTRNPYKTSGINGLAGVVGNKLIRLRPLWNI